MYIAQLYIQWKNMSSKEHIVPAHGHDSFLDPCDKESAHVSCYVGSIKLMCSGCATKVTGRKDLYTTGYLTSNYEHMHVHPFCMSVWQTQTVRKTNPDQRTQHKS